MDSPQFRWDGNFRNLGGTQASPYDNLQLEDWFLHLTCNSIQTQSESSDLYPSWCGFVSKLLKREGQLKLRMRTATIYQWWGALSKHLLDFGPPKKSSHVTIRLPPKASELENSTSNQCALLEKKRTWWSFIVRFTFWVRFLKVMPMSEERWIKTNYWRRYPKILRPQNEQGRILSIGKQWSDWND